MNKRLRHQLLTALLLSSQLALAGDLLFPADPHAARPLQVELHIPRALLLKAKPDEEELAGRLVLADGTQFNVGVSPRGKSRLEHCSFPPLWLNFEKKAVVGTLFTKQNKLKLVTHCSSKLASREYLATEMLAYRLLNIMTDYSFRVRALEINYVDTQRNNSESRFGFLIEHKKRLAKRLGLEVLDTPGIKLADLEPNYAGLIGVFSFMIGNTDFSMRRGPEGNCCHNAVPLKAATGVFPVPYDFDASGLVNPPYAAPAQNLRIRRLTQRLYRGYCKHNALLPQIVTEFEGKKSELLALVESFDDIPGLRRKKTSKFLARFYEVIGAEGSVRSKLIKRCR